MNTIFWDTVAGHQFTENLIQELDSLVQELPKLTRKGKQIVMTVDCEKIKEVINTMIERGYRYYDAIPLKDTVILIFEDTINQQ